MKRAIIYGRVSTNKQSAESIETQIYECQKWARNNNCMIVDIYDDSGQNGQAYNVGNREGFQQIRQDAKLGRMDYALIHRIDRFARSVADYFIQERALQDYGVEIIVVGMPFFQDADIITKSVHIAVAEQFSTNLSNEVSGKMRTFARKGAFLGGKPPYGFNVELNEAGEKVLKINPEEALGVKMIYQLYLQGFGYIQISKMLAENGYTNEKNQPFTPTHIRKMLMSKKYNGWYVFGIREKVKGKDRITKDKEKLIEIPDVYDKLIDDKTFDAVQNKMQSKAPKNKRKSRHYPFTGLMICGSCGRAVTGSCTVKKDRNNQKYIYYRCTGYKVNGCKVPAVRADYLESYVADKIKKHVFDEDFTNQLIKEIELNLSGDVSSFVRTKNEIEKELQRVINQIKEAMKDKYNPEIDKDIYEDVVADFRRDRALLEVRLANINQQLNINDKTKEIREYVLWLRNNLEKADENIKNAILQQVVQSIVITPENINIFVYISTPPKKSARHYLSSPNISRGVPLCTIGKQGKVYTSNGQNVVQFGIGNILDFNINAK